VIKKTICDSLVKEIPTFQSIPNANALSIKDDEPQPSSSQLTCSGTTEQKNPTCRKKRKRKSVYSKKETKSTTQENETVSANCCRVYNSDDD
jgi:hypothetical protein